MNASHYGARFGRLTYKRKATTASSGNKRGLLKCDCGTETIARHSDLASGKVTACRGCRATNQPAKEE